MAGADFHNAADDVVEELAVVGNDHDAASVGFQVILKPQERFEVQVVGGLVEQEEIGLLHEEAGEVGAHHPAAAEFAGGAVKVLFAETEAGEYLLGLGIELVAAEFVKAVVGVVMDFFRVSGVNVVVGIPGQDEFAEAGEFGGDGGGEFEDGFVPGGRAFLREIAEVDAAFLDDLAGVGGFLTEDDPKERGLAGAIGADEADAVLAVHLQGGLIKEHLAAIGFADFRKSQHTN